MSETVCKGSVFLGTACGKCERCKNVSSEVWACAIRDLAERHAGTIRQLNESHAKEIERTRTVVYEQTVASMLQMPVNCGHSSVCSVAGWFQDSINKHKAKEPA